MKSILAIVVCLVLMASSAYAVTREVQYNQEDQSNVGQLGITGSAQPGNPGYIALSAPNNGNALFTYYLWVNGGGKVCVASYPVISAYSSFPSGNWNTNSSTMGCTVVGGQS